MTSRIARIADATFSGNLGVIIDNRRRARSGEPPRMLAHPRRHSGPEGSSVRVNRLIALVPSADRYLEIGVKRGATLQQVRAAHRLGVDPSPICDSQALPQGLSFFVGTSDAFFESLAAHTRFDVVFLDGLHTFEQTYRDLLNALRHIDRGAILIDDTVPSDEVSAIPDLDESLRVRAAKGMTDNAWHGDVWKVVLQVAYRHAELEYRTIIGPGNPQTLVWKRPDPDLSIESRPVIDGRVLAATYRTVFSEGVPADFKPCDEAKALAECSSAIAAGSH